MQGCKCTPKCSDLVKILEKSRSLGKICENLCKITEESGQTPQKYNKNGVKCAFSCEIGAKSDEDVFLEVIQNPEFMQCIKDGPKFFRASLVKFWQKSFAPLKCMCSCTYGNILAYVFPTQPAQHFHSCISHGPQQKILCSPVRSAEWPTIGQRPTVFRPQTCIFGSITAFRIGEKCCVFFGQPLDKIRAGFSSSEALTLSFSEASLSHCYEEKVEKD